MTEPAPVVTAAQVPDGAVLLDVREQDEWDAGHAPGAIHVPLGDLPSRLADLPEEAELQVLCRAGGRASRAASWLLENGYDAVVVEGGMGAWQDAGRPVVSEDGSEPRVI
ncbi:Rhodanese-related sulfurtransferase [Quadrisphaera granulorum]|uniref:Rhodanese-related sulfurtransferase n=1 Tax=Quadrisphaera granulorum TaxID=317664 RepID=A0A316AFN3_9ACTN|nr:rhodanese-like domain-containing protein [Quadrisphaera granulorum]PWJ55714.1 rhodanese-related sulfurtransferase [Quadrisphaera granulorum]SZE95211.1 Rhodanese-related sulfurtransferase [Quadrisphaera granulorum]